MEHLTQISLVKFMDTKKEASKQIGYPPELFCGESFLFTKNHLQCKICHQVIKDCLRCPQDCNFCRGCIESALKKRHSCPGCKAPIKMNILVPNRFANNIIQNLVVVCKESASFKKPIIVETLETPKKRKFSEVLAMEDVADKISTPEELGCTWTGPLKNLEAHLNTECAFTMTKCTMCSFTGLRSQLKEHMVVHDPSPCPFCKNLVPGGKHWWCPSELSHECDRCKLKLTLDDYYDHSNICPLATIPCPYEFITGCTFQCARKDMQTHTIDASMHFQSTKILDTIVAMNNAIEKLSEGRCITAVNEVMRELAAPIFPLLGARTGNESFKNASDLYARLDALKNLVEGDYDEDNYAKKCKMDNRFTIINKTDACEVLGSILRKHVLFSHEQVLNTLHVIAGIFFHPNGTGSEDLSLETFNEVEWIVLRYIVNDSICYVSIELFMLLFTYS